MAIEKRWEAIAPRLFTSNGGTEGQITLTSTIGFKVKQQVILKSTSQSGAILEVKRVVSQTLMLVGNPGNINDRKDISAYLVADGASVESLEQPRPNIHIQEHENAVYAEEPIVAKRVIQVDRLGNYFDADNPFPVTVEGITIDNVSVQLDHVVDDSGKFDSVRIGNGVTGRTLEIYPSKDIDIRRFGTTPNQKLKNAIMCMPDVLRELTWTLVNGVRRITKIEWTSASLAAQEGVTQVKLTRDFVYGGTPNFDLEDINDTLTVTP